MRRQVLVRRAILVVELVMIGRGEWLDYDAFVLDIEDTKTWLAKWSFLGEDVEEVPELGLIGQGS